MIKNMVASLLKVPVELIKSDQDFFEDLRIGSMRMVMLFLALEKVCGVEFDEATADSIKTVGDLERYIESHKTC